MERNMSADPSESGADEPVRMVRAGSRRPAAGPRIIRDQAAMSIIAISQVMGELSRMRRVMYMLCSSVGDRFREKSGIETWRKSGQDSKRKRWAKRGAKEGGAGRGRAAPEKREGGRGRQRSTARSG